MSAVSALGLVFLWRLEGSPALATLALPDVQLRGSGGHGFKVLGFRASLAKVFPKCGFVLRSTGHQASVLALSPWAEMVHALRL